MLDVGIWSFHCRFVEGQATIPLSLGTTDREAFDSCGATNWWRAWEAIGPG